MSNYGPKINAHKTHRIMGNGKRTPEQRESDLQVCTNMFLKGYTYQQITDTLNEKNEEQGYTLTLRVIYKDIQDLLIRWKKEQFENIDNYVTQELRKLDKIENELWEAWEASKLGKRKTKIAGGTMNSSGTISGGSVKERDLETTSGNPKYLDLILNVQQRRAKLLGFDAPLKIDIHNRPGNNAPVETQEYNFNDIPEDMLSSMVETMMRKTSERINSDRAEEL